MNQDLNKKIQNCWTFIRNNLTHVDSIIANLIEKGVIPLQEGNDFMGGKLPKEQIQMIVDVVMRKDKGVEFILALTETNNEHVVKQILSSDVNDCDDLKKIKTFIMECDTPEPTECKITKELNNTKQDNAHLRKIQQNLRSQIEDKVTRLKDVNAQLIECKTAQKELEKCNEKLETERKELAEQNKEIDHLQQMVEYLQKQIDEKDEKIVTLNLSLKGVEDKLKHQMTSQKKVTDQLLKDNKKLKNENAQIKSICVKMSGKLTEIIANQTRFHQTRSKQSKIPSKVPSKIRNKPWKGPQATT